MSEPLRWPLEALWEATVHKLPGFTVELLKQIDSTNSECLRRLRSGDAAPLLLVAQQQTAGRGRMGRTWQSLPDGAALTFSLALPLAPQSWSGLSLAVGLSVVQALQPQAPQAGTDTPRIALKWPNDLWLQGIGAERKLGGILVETASLMAPIPGRPKARWVVVGVGLNIVVPDAAGMSVPPAGLQQVDAGPDAPMALARTVPLLVDALLEFEKHGFAPLVADFAERDVLAGRHVRLSDGREGLAIGVGQDGALRVRIGAETCEVNSADVSVRPRASEPSGAAPAPGAL